MSNEEIIREFLTKISEQDSRGTASPYFYVIKTKEKINFGTKRPNIDTEDIGIEFINEYHEEISPDEYDKELGHKIFYYREIEVEKGLFLTESDAEAHLQANYYHYSDDAYIYVKHAWRAPELYTFFVALFNYFEIPKGNTDLKGLANEW